MIAAKEAKAKEVVAGNSVCYAIVDRITCIKKRGMAQ